MVEESKKSKYVYYNRDEGDEEASAAPSTRVPKKAKANKAPNAGHHYFVTNVKTSLGVLAVMSVLAGAAFLISTRTWDAKAGKYNKEIEQLKIQREARQAKANEIAASLNPADQVNSTASGETIGGGAKQDLDTKAIAKAVFLAKRAEALKRAEDYNGAVKRYKEALELWPYLGQVWADLGDTYIRAKQYGHAQVALQRAAHSIPDSAEILCNLGLTFLHQREIARALDIFDAAREIDPKFAKTHYFLGLVYIAQEDYDIASEYLQDYLDFVPDDADALREMAYIEAKQNRYSKALEYIKKALAEAPDTPELYFDAAASSALLGRVEDAIRFLEKGEAFTNPYEAYQTYQKPAFREVRLSGMGKIYEQELADRARRTMRERQSGKS